MIKIEPASDYLYNITMLLNGMVRSFPITIDKKSMVCPIADVEYAFTKHTGYKDVRVMSLMKVKEIINVEL